MAGTAGGERRWEDAFQEIIDDYERTTKTCRHGDHQIHLTPRGTWEDDTGIEVCVKATIRAGLAARGMDGTPRYVVHEPVPGIPQ